MSIYTGKGDGGQSSLADGTRVSKASRRLEACGAVDEAAAFVGLARAAVEHRLIVDLLDFAVRRLGTCAAVLGNPEPAAEGSPVIDDSDVKTLEDAIDRFEAHTGPLPGFIALKGSESAMRLHVARTVVRRAERRVVKLNAEEPVSPPLLAFINRLSDALFAASRFANVSDGMPEELWDADAPRPKF